MDKIIPFIFDPFQITDIGFANAMTLEDFDQ